MCLSFEVVLGQRLDQPTIYSNSMNKLQADKLKTDMIDNILYRTSEIVKFLHSIVEGGIVSIFNLHQFKRVIMLNFAFQQTK